MANFTLFELHLDDGNLQLGSSGLDFVPDEEDIDADEGTETDDESTSSGRGVLTYLLVLAVLVGVAFAAKRFLGGPTDGFEELEELDDLSEEPERTESEL